MPEPRAVRLYLVTPPALSLVDFPDRLAAVLDRFDIACLRLDLAAASEEAVARTADVLRGVCHARDVPLVVTDHFRLVRRLGLDGVHLSDGSRHVRAARKELGDDSIVGVYGHASRHEGLTAAENGADYVSFGPIADTGLGDGAVAAPDLFAWWSEMVEVPVVAEGGITVAAAAELAKSADFIALGDEVWAAPEGPMQALEAYTARLGSD